MLQSALAAAKKSSDSRVKAAEQEDARLREISIELSAREKKVSTSL